MDNIVELIKRNEQLFFENAEQLNDEEVEQEDIDEYYAIQGATEEQLSAFEQQFQIKLPEDFKCAYKYKNGSGYIGLLWPQKDFYERIKPYLFCERWFPFAEYAGSLYLMLDYNPSPKGTVGQIICYVHDPDFVYYIASDITEALKLTETVIEELV